MFDLIFDGIVLVVNMIIQAYFLKMIIENINYDDV